MILSFNTTFSSYTDVFNDALADNLIFGVLKGFYPGNISPADILNSAYLNYKKICLFELDQNSFENGLTALFNEKYP